MTTSTLFALSNELDNFGKNNKEIDGKIRLIATLDASKQNLLCQICHYKFWRSILVSWSEYKYIPRLQWEQGYNV